MRIDVPFYEDHKTSTQCVQVAMKSVLDHYLDKKFTLKELDYITGRKKDFWTWVPQASVALYDLGLDVRHYSKSDLVLPSDEDAFDRGLDEKFGKDSDKIRGFTDIPVVFSSFEKLKCYDLFEQKNLSLKDLESHLEQGHVPLTLIDYNKIIGKQDNYQGHFVAVTGFDKDNISFHDSGSWNYKAHRKVDRNVFLDAWNSESADKSTIIVYGKR